MGHEGGPAQPSEGDGCSERNTHNKTSVLKHSLQHSFSIALYYTRVS